MVGAGGVEILQALEAVGRAGITSLPFLSIRQYVDFTMGKLLGFCAVVLACITIGSALQCLKCKFTIFNIPCHTTTVTCDSGEVCAVIQGSAAGHKLIRKKDCVAQDKCDKNSTDSFVGVSYTTTYKCCDGDFCNSGATLPSAHISLPMLVVIGGTWLLRFL